MPRYEYKVVPAPVKGRKARGVKSPEGRFALSVEDVLNEMGAEGWEYLRAELLPSEERSGLTGSTTHWRNVLVFRRALAAQGDLLDPLPERERPEREAAPMLAATAAGAAVGASNIPELGAAGPRLGQQAAEAPEHKAEPEAEAETARQVPEPAGEMEEMRDSDGLESFFAPEPDPEPEYYQPPEPEPEPERRTPPTLGGTQAAPLPESDAADAMDSAETSGTLHHTAESASGKWGDEDETSLSGIEKVVRRNARHSAEQRDGQDEG
jgi:hypothetical protein